MIIQCNKCQKSFVVPDNAITSNGRLVQCSACGNQWKQYPENLTNKSPKKIKSKEKPKKTVTSEKKIVSRKKSKKKTRNVDVYSEEYLQKKHGIKIIDPSSLSEKKTYNKKLKNEKINTGLGFYSYILIFIIVTTSLLGIINLTDQIIISNFPMTENYLTYLFETLNNFKTFIFDFLDL